MSDNRPSNGDITSNGSSRAEPSASEVESSGATRARAPERRPSASLEVRRARPAAARRLRYVGVGVLGTWLGSVGLSMLASESHAQAPAPAPEPAAPAAPPAAPPAPDPAAPPAPAAPAAPEPAPAGEAAAPAEPAPADAAAEPPPEEDAPFPGTEDDSLDVEEPLGAQAEVVVTVDRRRKDLQDYSGTASAFSASQLSAIGIQNVRDLSVAVPGLQVGTQESGTTVYIRGIGSDNNTELGDPAVAIHADGVYLPRPRGIGGMFFDIERVEVNSGPQGTLRGRNAVGGTINIVTKQPNLQEFEAFAEATFGTYAQRTYTGMVNIPLVTEHLGLRVAAQSQVHDPHWENAGPIHDLRGMQDQNDYALRVTAKYAPSKRFDLTLAYDFLHEGGVGNIGANFQPLFTRLQDPGTDPGMGDDLYYPFDVNAVDNPRRIYQRGMQASLNTNHQGVRATANFDLGPVLFEALGSFRDLDYKQWSGASAGAVVEGIDNVSTQNPDIFGGQNQWHTTSKSYIGELRAYAPDTERLRWTVGGFYFYEDQGAFLGQANDRITGGGSGGGEFNMPHTIGWSVAGYADATFDVVDDFRVLGGIRLTREHKDRKNGFWGLWNGTPPADFVDGVTPGTSLGRYGTEGFEYKGFDRPSYTRDGDDATARVNLFLDGIESFGARDEVPIALCNDPQEGQPRLILNEEGNWRCQAGVRQELNDLAPALFNFVPQNNETDNTFVDYRLGVEYDLQKDNLLYATFSTGHKAAGFNDTVGVTGAGFFNSEYGPETVYSLELGSKNMFLERRLKVNASAFYFGYTGMQFQTIVAVAPDDDPTDTQGPPSSAVRQNAQERTDVFGLDADVVYSLPAGLEAELHALIMDARFSDGTIVNDSRLNFGGDNAFVDLGGNWLPRASPYTLNYTLSQLIFTAAGSFNWVVQGQTRGTHYMTVFNGNGERLVQPVEGNVEGTMVPNFNTNNPNYQIALNNLQRFDDEVPTYTVFNFGAGWKHPDGRLGLSLFVNNVFNIAYANMIVSTSGANTRYYNPPRIVGLRARVDW
jgi:iron complex outermembrane receptor protein